MSLSKWLIAVVLCAIVLCSTGARGDLVRLPSGGEARGVILNTDKAAKTTSIQTRSGVVITLSEEEIDFVSRRSAKVEEYVTRSRQIEHTVEAHLELAEWCRSQSLLEQRGEQLEQVLDLDPDHPDARKTLGYVRHLGRWMTQEDVMAERGYFRHQGRWVTRQELELLENNATQKNAELRWNPKIRTWVSWLTGPHTERQQTALNELQAIRDADAVSALTRFMAPHQVPDVRFLFIKILQQIDGPRPVPPLVDRALLDPHEKIREEALNVLLAGRTDLAFPYFISALRHKSNPVVCRAAAALAEIGNEKAVPSLIEALITTHSYQKEVATPLVGMRFTGGTGAAGVFSGLMPPNVEIAARTGQLPAGVNIRSDQATPIVMRRVTISEDVKNPDVLAALEKLTGKDFGFNERNWYVWWAANNG